MFQFLSLFLSLFHGREIFGSKTYWGLIDRDLKFGYNFRSQFSTKQGTTCVEDVTSLIHSSYQKTDRNIKKYEIDLKFYEDKESEKYIQYKQELEQKYEKEENRPKKQK